MLLESDQDVLNTQLRLEVWLDQPRPWEPGMWSREEQVLVTWPTGVLGIAEMT